jgi:hypothetical protein
MKENHCNYCGAKVNLLHKETMYVLCPRLDVELICGQRKVYLGDACWCSLDHLISWLHLNFEKGTK